MVAKIERSKLLRYKQRDTLDFNQTFIYKHSFDLNVLNFNDILFDSFFSLKEKFSNLQDKKLMDDG